MKNKLRPRNKQRTTKTFNTNLTSLFNRQSNLNKFLLRHQLDVK